MSKAGIWFEAGAQRRACRPWRTYEELASHLNFSPFGSLYDLAVESFIEGDAVGILGSHCSATQDSMARQMETREHRTEHASSALRMIWV